MVIIGLKEDFTICKVEDLSEIDFNDPFCFLGITDEELSLVCQTEKTPQNTTHREDGWKAMRIQGELDFSLVGILANISTILAEKKIGIFAISTYNTDYILVKENQLNQAFQALREAGYTIVDPT
ncbi:MAG: ACT domain-containing protein [Tissierellia bacterium]|nr:ACT domain-containing protein [Tissierellia bacterium]